MDDFETRLTASFAAVFPNLRPEQIRQASTETLSEWDSLHHINLLVVLSDEFGIEIDYEDVAEMGSYAAVAEYLQRRLAQ